MNQGGVSSFNNTSIRKKIFKILGEKYSLHTCRFISVPHPQTLTLVDPVKLPFKCEERVVISDLQMHTKKIATHAVPPPPNF